MKKNMSEVQLSNLRPVSATADAKKRGSSGGKKARVNKQERKMMSEIYGHFLGHEHDVIGRDGYKKRLTGEQLISGVVSKILARGDSASVSLMREMREATEGNKNYMGGLAEAPPLNITIVGIDPEDVGGDL